MPDIFVPSRRGGAGDGSIILPRSYKPKPRPSAPTFLIFWPTGWRHPRIEAKVKGWSRWCQEMKPDVRMAAALAYEMGADRVVMPGEEV